METYLLVLLEKLSLGGFLGTRASLGQDLIMIFLILLPILSSISIFFAIRQKLKLHQVTQFLLFFLTFLALSFFAYSVHYEYGFEILVQESDINITFALVVLIIHITIAIVTLMLWMFALMYALSDRKRRALPGLYSESHTKAGKRVFKSIVLTTLSSVGIYWMLFMA